MILERKDKVAIVSPSSTIAGAYPWVFELGIERLRSVFSLDPVVMPHCLDTQATQKDKARDLHDSYSNPDFKAVFSCTGGIDQIQLIPHLDPTVFKNNPKPFFGYSDNTHLNNFLYSNNVKSFYGGSILSQFAMQGQMCKETVDSLNWALFRNQDWFEIKAPSYCIDEDHPWDDPQYLNIARRTEVNKDGLIFDGTGKTEGILWGGCLESLGDLLRVQKRTPMDFTKLILFLETSEEIPSHEFVRRFMISLGKAGILSSIKGLLVGRPKTWFFDNKMNANEKANYRDKQKETILSVVRVYNNTIPVVMNLSIGHTDPQLIIPYGGLAKINTMENKIHISHKS